MTTLIHWFRNDLRLHDNAALLGAVRRASRFIAVFVDEDSVPRITPWGFPRMGPHRRAFLLDSLADLDARLSALGSRLTILRGSPRQVLPALARQVGATTLTCEAIAAPEEMEAVRALRASGLEVDETWQSTLLPLEALPFPADAVPDVFTDFRQKVERAGVVPLPPWPSPRLSFSRPDLPSSPPSKPRLDLPPPPGPNARSELRSPPVSNPCTDLPASVSSEGHPDFGVGDPPRRQPDIGIAPGFRGGESAALAHLQAYFSRPLAHHYKATRNALDGPDSSTRFSPWLATGAMSPRQAYAALKAFESAHGANEGTYWIWFELLWRDHFRLLHLKHGGKLYRRSGLGRMATASALATGRSGTGNTRIGATSRPPGTSAERESAVEGASVGAAWADAGSSEESFARWCEGCTGEALVDAGMRELLATGWLSNRMRQIVASFLIHDMGCDWRAGAAWFESQLLDFDVHSNQGNWLYIAGLGTDPRGGRRFDPVKQAHQYDPQGAYRRKWGTG